MRNKDIIVYRTRNQKPDVYSYYIENHHKTDIDLVRVAIAELYPDYLAIFDGEMKSTDTYCFNMFITSKDIFDEYCAWLFDLLFFLNDRIDYQSYDSYQKRVFGFLSERLLKVWIAAKGLRVALR